MTVDICRCLSWLIAAFDVQINQDCFIVEGKYSPFTTLSPDYSIAG